MQSKTLLILATIAIIAVSSTVVALHTLHPPEHETLEVLRVERKEFKGSNVWLRWFGNNTELYISVRTEWKMEWQGQLVWVGKGDSWSVLASYGRVFNISIPDGYWCTIHLFDVVRISVRSNGELRFSEPI